MSKINENQSQGKNSDEKDRNPYEISVFEAPSEAIREALTSAGFDNSMNHLLATADSIVTHLSVANRKQIDEDFLDSFEELIAIYRFHKYLIESQTGKKLGYYKF